MANGGGGISVCFPTKGGEGEDDGRMHARLK